MKLRELGARGLQNAVDELADRLFWDYVNTDDEVDEKTNKRTRQVYHAASSRRGYSGDCDLQGGRSRRGGRVVRFHA